MILARKVQTDKDYWQGILEDASETGELDLALVDKIAEAAPGSEAEGGLLWDLKRADPNVKREIIKLLAERGGRDLVLAMEFIDNAEKEDWGTVFDDPKIKEILKSVLQENFIRDYEKDLEQDVDGPGLYAVYKYVLFAKRHGIELNIPAEIKSTLIKDLREKPPKISDLDEWTRKIFKDVADYLEIENSVN